MSLNILILCFALFATHNWFSVLWLVVYEENKVPVVQHPLVVIQQCLYFVPSKNEMENLSSLTPILCSKAGYYWVFMVVKNDNFMVIKMSASNAV